MSSSLPLLRFDDDILQSTFEWLLNDARAHADMQLPLTVFRVALGLSHICQRFRALALSRQAFWRDLHCGTRTSQEAVLAILDRSGATPIKVRMVCTEDYPRIHEFGPVWELIIGQLHRAETIDVQIMRGRIASILDSADFPTLPYTGRPLQKLRLRNVGVGQLLSLVGPRLTTVELINVNDTIQLEDFAVFLAFAPKLCTLDITMVAFMGNATAAVALCSRLLKPTSLRRGHLLYLRIDCIPVAQDILRLIMEAFPETAKKAKYITVFSGMDGAANDGEVHRLLDITGIGPPSGMTISDETYWLEYDEARGRNFDLSISTLRRSIECRRVVSAIAATAATLKLEIAGYNAAPVDWLKNFLGSTWSALKRLEIRIHHNRGEWGPPDASHWVNWDANPHARIVLPILQKVVIHGFRKFPEDEDQAQVWAIESLSALDCFDFSKDIVEVTISPDDYFGQELSIEYLQKVLEEAHREHYGHRAPASIP
ncbi:hypothetical protein BKA62DRAFT_695353 [Auriculariales sp. MPI-PUGE-AT-0066]|nr:hypothetical protein BKA62DRAFT_695353 [Auriculariales sp. MPI-PUGE-AT-0066]